MKLYIVALSISLFTLFTSLSANENDLKFEQIKSSVFQYLNTSWVSQEKAQILMDLTRKTEPEICVDIGSFTGSSALPVATTLKFLNKGKIYLIDAWSNLEAVKYINPEDPNYFWWSNLDMSLVKKQCLDTIHQWSLEPHCIIIQATSEQAIHQIPSIDFLHIDGNFSKEGSLLDTELYLSKVKTGGYILLSNVFVVCNHETSKMSAMWILYDKCELINELDNGNTLLFKKTAEN